MIRVAFESACRAAAVSMLEDFRDDASIKLQVYRARPATLNPPTAFVDAMSESITLDGPTLMQRTPRVDVIVVHGLFDSGEAADQRDAFVDGFIDWVADRYHAAGDATLIAPTSVDDLPNFIPDWLPPERQRSYYATRLVLEGFATT